MIPQIIPYNFLLFLSEGRTSASQMQLRDLHHPHDHRIEIGEQQHGMQQQQVGHLVPAVGVLVGNVRRAVSETAEQPYVKRID